MTWTDDNQTRLNRLREKELAGTLTEPEQAELAALMSQIEAEEARALAPDLDRLRAEAAARDARLIAVQNENEELARLLAQQQKLADDAGRFVAQFEQRHASSSTRSPGS